MGSNLTFVKGTTRINLDNRITHFLQAGYYPSVDVKEKTITESVKVQLRGPVSEKVQELNRWFELARTADPAQEQVYLEYQIGAGETAWRSRVYDGAVSLGSGAAREYALGRVNVEIAFERDAFWEGPETNLAITNANGGPARVYNANDGAGSVPNKRVNTASVAAGAVLGDVPTPVKLVIDNLYTQTLGYAWIGMNKTLPGWTSGWMLEAESATGITPVTSVDASGGAYAQGQMAYGQAQAILRWNLADTLVSAVSGHRVKMLIRPFFTGVYSNFRYRLRIVTGLTVLWETDWVRESEFYGRHWLDMFEFRLPPWLEGKGSLAGLTLELWASPTATGTWTWAFDDVMLFPEDGFVSLDTMVVAGAKLVIDGDTGWSEDAAGKKTGLRKMTGSLVLDPGAYHRFMFALHENLANSAPIDFLVGVSGSYRPRRLSI